VRDLFATRGFRWEVDETFGNSEWYVGQDLYRQIAYPGKQYAWRSPICPLCGYRASSSARGNGQSTQHTLAGSLLRRVREVPKAVWPKRRKPYWILARYARVEEGGWATPR
jgi:hypothetical protein